MKQIHTQKKSANRGPSKTNYNKIETMPVEKRRELGIFSIDSRARGAIIYDGIKEQ